MANDGFDEVQGQREEAASELKTVNDPDRRTTLLREMSRLLAEAQRISGQPRKLIHKQPYMVRFTYWRPLPEIRQAGRVFRTRFCDKQANPAEPNSAE